MAAAFTVRVEEIRPLIFKMRALERKVQRRLKKKAVGAAGRVVLKAARRLVPRGATGLLRDALSVNSKARGKSAVAVVGPRTGGRWVGPRKGVKYRKLSKIGERYAQQGVYPPFYAHMVEKGHGGRRGPARARPFLGPALERNRESAFLAMRDTLSAGILKEQGGD